jgi:hypothetical protein
MVFVCRHAEQLMATAKQCASAPAHASNLAALVHRFGNPLKQIMAAGAAAREG